MIIFSLVLLLMLIIALAFFLVPLLSKQAIKSSNAQAKINQQIYQQQATQLKQNYEQGLLSELEYRSLQDELILSLLDDEANFQSTPVLPAEDNIKNNNLIIFISIVFCIIAIGAYLLWGNPKVVLSHLQQQQNQVAAQKMLAELKTPEQVIDKLKQAIQANPQDPKGWFLLGRLYMDMQNFSAARQAFAKANQLQPNDPDIMLNYAQVLFVQNHNQLTPLAKQLLQNIITQDPANPGVINLLALDAYSRGDYQQAINYWQSLLANMPPDTDTAKALQRAIDNAQAELAKQAKKE